MAVSNVFTFNLTETNLIASALRKLGVLAEGQSPTTNQATYAREAINLTLKNFMNLGMPLWYIRQGYLFPDENTNTFLLGPSGANWTDSFNTGYLTSDEATATIGISFDDPTSSTYPANTDKIGIELDDGSVDWTTVSAGGGTANLTITPGLTSAASANRRWYSYTNKAQRPETILDGYLVYSATNFRRPIAVVEESTVRQVNLAIEGGTVYVNYVPWLVNGKCSIWPRFADGASYLELRYQAPFDDSTTGADTMAIPVNWQLALVYAVAVTLAPEYQVNPNTFTILKKEAEFYKSDALAGSMDTGSLFLQPAYQPSSYRP
jgi:hypothetical protein